MATTKPNILLIIADDLGVDTLRVDDKTDQVIVQLIGTAAYPLPNLSRLVSKGIHFTRTWAHPVCAPTRATLFTGLHPWRTGVGDAVDDPVLRAKLPREGDADLKTLAHFVSTAGYRTCLLGKWDLGTDRDQNTPSARGWHRHEGILAGGLRFLNENPANRPNYETLIQQDVRYVSWAKVIGDVDSGFQDNIEAEAREYKYATEDNVLSARNWIKQQSGKTPWWATLALLAPHDPFHVPPKGTFTIKFQNPAKPTVQEMFVAMMESMDYYMGKLFDDPDIQKQLANTVIMFMGDNGSQDELDVVLGDDKSSVYIGGVHVPLLIADGGAIFGDGPCYLDRSVISKENDNFVHVVDLFQTIIEMAGGTGPTAYKTDSISLLPYLKSNTNEQFRSYSFGQFFVPPNSLDPIVVGRYQKLGQRATISDGKYKLNYQNGTYEFFELNHDPVTDQTAEIVINQIQHPKAQELWRALTTPGSGYYAEADDKGKKFPPLPQSLPEMVAFGDVIKLSHAGTGKLLHSHSLNYRHPGTSGQQQVTCYAGADMNDDWLIKGAHGQSEEFGKGEPIRHGSIVRLEHVSTRRNLHSHANIPSPYTGQQEVTAFGDRIGNDSDNWRIEVEGGGIGYKGKRIRLIHFNTNCALHSHDVPAHSDYTAGQQEVTGFGGRDNNDWWYFISR